MIRDMPRLPRIVESDPRCALVLRALSLHPRPLWPGGTIAVPSARLDPHLSSALRSVHHAGRAARGLEKAEHRLAREEQGLLLADRRGGAQRGVRVSRLLILTDDGAERFYRRVESLLRRHGPRVLALRLDAGASTLGEMLYGPGRIARLLMIEHKEAVSSVLLALAGQGDAGPVDTRLQEQ